MIGQYLSNANESATISILPNNLELNNAQMVKKTQPNQRQYSLRFKKSVVFYFDISCLIVHLIFFANSKINKSFLKYL